MREIKFRAWEKHLKEMIPVQDIDFENKMINAENAWRLFNEVELMQYTGLKDKNGKEIYEGDILIGSAKVPCFVSWDEMNACYTALSITKRICILSYEYKNREVIGNIYENPELLEGVS